jgi:hypothetical protein
MGVGPRVEPITSRIQVRRFTAWPSIFFDLNVAVELVIVCSIVHTRENIETCLGSTSHSLRTHIDRQKTGPRFRCIWQVLLDAGQKEGLLIDDLILCRKVPESCLKFHMYWFSVRRHISGLARFLLLWLRPGYLSSLWVSKEHNPDCLAPDTFR